MRCHLHVLAAAILQQRNWWFQALLRQGLWERGIIDP